MDSKPESKMNLLYPKIAEITMCEELTRHR